MRPASTAAVVLVAAGDDSTRAFLYEALRRPRLRVLVACTASSALEIIKRFRRHIHAVVSESDSPNMNGMELAAEIGRTKPQIPILLVSGTAADAKAEAAGLGCRVRFLHKPLKSETVISAVDELCRRDADPRGKRRTRRRPATNEAGRTTQSSRTRKRSAGSARRETQSHAGALPARAGLLAADVLQAQVREIQSCAMFIVDQGGAFATWNAGVERLFGYTEQEWLGRDESMILPRTPDVDNLSESTMRRPLPSGETTTGLCRYCRKDGSEFPARRFTSAIRDNGGRIIGSSTVIEIDPELLNHSLDALEQLARATNYVLCEPMRIVASYAQLLVRRYFGKMGPDGDQFLNFLLDSAMSTRKIMEAALVYAQVRTGKRAPSPLALDKGVDAALAALSQAVDQSSARITRDPLPTVMADHSRVVWLLQDLIANAIQYRKPGRHPEIHISAERQNGDWVVSVCDEGIGFAPEQSEMMLLPFSHLDKGGYGAGACVDLAVCRCIIEAEGGKIRAESKPGEGSRFEFTLPAYDPSSMPTDR